MKRNLLSHRVIWIPLIWILILQLSLVAKLYAQEPITVVKWPAEINAEMLLGKQLFFDKMLSAKQSMSCASCHRFDHGGSIPQAKAQQNDGSFSRYNPSSIFNLSNNYPLGWEGQISSVEKQISNLMFKENIMGLSWPKLVKRLKNQPHYVRQFTQLYPDGITQTNIAVAIAQYELALTTPSPFDAYLQGNQQAISKDAVLGYELFKRYGCVSCHQGKKVGGNLLQKIGVINPYNYNTAKNTLSDLGRYNSTGEEHDRQVFRVPSLRNVADSPPYFHDGSIETLEQAVTLMGRHQLGLEISTKNVRLIIAFLSSLSGTPHPELLP